MNYLLIWWFTGGFVFKSRNGHSSKLLWHGQAVVFALLFGENDSQSGLCVFYFFYRFKKSAHIIELQNACALWLPSLHVCWHVRLGFTIPSAMEEEHVLFLCNVSVFLKSWIASKRSLNFLHTPYTEFFWQILHKMYVSKTYRPTLLMPEN